MHTNTFVSDWGVGENNFSEDPQSAVLSFLEERNTVPEEVTIVIRDPHLTEDTLTYKIEVLDGTLPPRAGPCTVFIDPFGRQLCPCRLLAYAVDVIAASRNDLAPATGWQILTKDLPAGLHHVLPSCVDHHIDDDRNGENQDIISSGNDIHAI
jgi:hypothetical protein